LQTRQETKYKAKEEKWEKRCKVTENQKTKKEEEKKVMIA